jgi:hypothetical protein
MKGKKAEAPKKAKVKMNQQGSPKCFYLARNDQDMVNMIDAKFTKMYARKEPFLY